MKGLASIGVVLAIAIGVLASTAAARSRPEGGLASCPAGSKPAVIAGKFKCLRVGQRCKTKYQAAYKKYGFTCVAGRLRRYRPAPPNPPAPPEPPAPPPPPQPVALPGHYQGLTSQLTTFEFDVTDGFHVTGIKTGQINEGCTPPGHIYGNIYNFGTYTLPLASDGAFTLDYPHQSFIDFPDARVDTNARLTITGHVLGSSATGNLELSVTFVYQGTPYSCGSGLQTWTATRTG